MAKGMPKKESRAKRPCSEEVWEERRKDLKTYQKGTYWMMKANSHPLTVRKVNGRIGIELSKCNLCLLTR